MNDHLSGKELFIRFTASAFRNLLSIYVFSYFPFVFEGRIWDLIVSVPDHCLSFYLKSSGAHFICGQIFLSVYKTKNIKLNIVCNGPGELLSF